MSEIDDELGALEVQRKTIDERRAALFVAKTERAARQQALEQVLELIEKHQFTPAELRAGR
jgi:DNA-binding protein H-NS